MTWLGIRDQLGPPRWLLVEPAEAVSFVMSQRMLRGIKDRAEAQQDMRP